MTYAVNRKNITGQRFGMLVAVKPAFKDPKKRTWYWEYMCDCGNITIKQGSSVTSQHIRSCGCLKKECIKYLSKDAAKKEYGAAARRVLYLNYKHNAKKRNIFFNLYFEEFKLLTTSNCVYCGREPSKIYQQKDLNGPCVYNGVDREDNSIGYVINNCVSCCHTCNMAKRAMSKIEFLEWVKRVAIHNKLTEMTGEDKIELSYLREQIANNKASENSSSGWGE